ncbi:MAG: TIGR02253 family HAD-type hydrolase [Candidatus Aenigmarchaeota archaeon]|nr:TIGR02253 family HAD-type hydrolase [Candidatus Aenigmarchaeota archaeon]
MAGAAIKAVLFDLDNTLIDFWKMKKAASKAALAAMIRAGLKTDKQVAWRTLNRLFDLYGIENQRIFEIFLKETTGRSDDRLLAAGVVAYRHAKELQMRPYPGVVPTLRQLRTRGLKLAIVTDAPRFQAWSRLFELKLDKYFDFIVALEDTGRKKPSRLPFRAALRKLHVKPAEAVMVGDSVGRDVLGAHKLGMRTVLAKYGQVWKETRRCKADHEIGGISELLLIV